MQEPVLEEKKKMHTVLKVAAHNKPLTKSQQAFNRLTTRIASLSREIETDAVRLRRLSSIFNTNITPLVNELGHEKIALAKAMAASYATVKLSAKQQQEAMQVIFELLDDAFSVVEPDVETAALYRQFAGVSYKESLQEEEQQMKEDLQEQLRDVFGINIDMRDFAEGPEGLAAFQATIQEKIALHQQEGKRKKTKKQVAKETSLQQQEEIKRRSIRTIYMSLAKLLHPDTEPDEALKKEKEEIMKEVTRAYNEKDLSALLKLEIQWLATENDHLEKLTDDTLQIYIAVLKEQLKELETEKIIQLSNPVFQPVIQFLSMNEKAAANAMAYEKQERLWYIQEMKTHTQSLQGDKRRNAIRDCIKYYYNAPASDNDFPSFNEMMDIFVKTTSRRG